jgi:hypothetical protein
VINSACVHHELTPIIILTRLLFAHAAKKAPIKKAPFSILGPLVCER